MLIQFANSIRPTRMILLLLAILASISVGASSLIFPSVYAPVIVGAVPVVLGVLALWFIKPAWALYVTLFVVSLPIGLIPPTWQSLLNRILTVVALAVWLFDIVFHHKRILWSSAHWFFLGFLTWSLTSFFWAYDLNVSRTILQVYSLRFILFFMVLINQIRTLKDLERLMMVLALIGWVVVISSIATALLTGYLPGTRLQVLESNSNGMGITALMALPGILWKTIRPGKPGVSVHHLLAIVYFVLAIVLIAISGSRGSAISLIITMLALLFFRQTRSWAFVCLFILLLASAFAPFIFTTTIERFSGAPGETTLGGRERIWPAGIDLITDHPWVGVGIGNSSWAVMPYLMMYGSVAGNTHSSLHNPLLVILADTGIPGLILYLGILASSILSAVRTHLLQRRQGLTRLYPYFSLVLAVFLGYMASWIKGGGLESDFSYFLVLALLLIPSSLDVSTLA